MGSENFQDSVNMFVVAYTSTLLFYVYLLHNVRSEFTKRGSWLIFRLLFIIAFIAEFACWGQFHKEYKEIKESYMTTHQVHPESEIISTLTKQVFQCRCGVIIVLIIVQVLEDCLCARISSRLCCDGKLEVVGEVRKEGHSRGESVYATKQTVYKMSDDLEMTVRTKTAPSPKRAPDSPKSPSRGEQAV